MNRIAAPPAALGWRLLAAVYDLLPVLALWMLVSATLLLTRGGEPVTSGSPAAWLELALLWATTGLYAGLSWRRGGQTLGMRAWHLRVVDASGAPPAARAVMLRYTVATLSLLALGVGFAWALLDPQRRTWHDLAAGTVVVRLPQSAAST